MSQDWSQADSDLYRQIAAIAVPARAEQLATLLTLIPYNTEEAFRVVELASGEGYWSAAILEAFPMATLLALDYEASMREATQQRIAPYDGRGQVAAFDLLKPDWYGNLEGADVVVSSLCVHHLDSMGKRHLFSTVQETISAALLIADLVLPQTPQARQLFAATWDRMAEAASIEMTLARDLFETFEREQWNLFRYPDDDFDKPDTLHDQLQWLSEAGFAIADCFWMQAGHAIYGGYQGAREGGISFEDALTIAHKALRG